jgi:3-hydroxyacyl-[acyl-carrier-protein] dehydratase
MKGDGMMQASRTTAIKRTGMIVDIEGIKKRLPHRYPFLMIDRIIAQEPGKCTAIKCVTENECHFTGHFPGRSIMPGMLIAEAMAQASSFVGAPTENADKPEQAVNGQNFLCSMRIDFKKPVIPGDVLVLETELVKKFGQLMKFNGTARVDDILIAEGSFSVAGL